MTKTKLNILPLPTFNRLGVNFIERDAAFEKENIIVPESAERQVIQFVEADSETSVTVAENAVLKLVQVFTGNRTAKLAAKVADNARFELIQLYLGGDTVSETVVQSQGRRASFTADIGYDLGSGDALDINLAAEQHGRKSMSDITVNGVLRGNARKTFKGTIDFKNGASGAKGSEKEDVILIGGEVVNKTVPVILCSEEDVDGSHGASIGRIDERHIYYMQSRGIPEEKIYEMITRARLARIIEMIGDEQAERRVYDILGWGDDDE